MCRMYEKIQALCERKGIKPAAMCRETGLSRSLMTELKSGRTKSLSAKNARIIADYFGVSTDYLLGQEEKPTADGDELGEYLEVLKNREECRMLFQLAKDASKADVEEAVRIIEAIRGRG